MTHIAAVVKRRAAENSRRVFYACISKVAITSKSQRVEFAPIFCGAGSLPILTHRQIVTRLTWKYSDKYLSVTHLTGALCAVCVMSCSSG